MKHTGPERKALLLKERIQEAVEHCTSIEKAAFFCGISIATLRKYCSMLGIKLSAIQSTKGRPAFKHESVDEALVKTLFDQGLNYHQISARTGMSVHSLCRYIQTTDWSRRTPNVRRLENSISPRIRAIFTMRNSGWTLQQLADQYGLSRERIRQILVRYDGCGSINRLFAENFMLCMNLGWTIEEFIQQSGLKCTEEDLRKTLEPLMCEQEIEKYFAATAQ